MENSQGETIIPLNTTSAKHKVYTRPMIIIEMNLETRAGGSPPGGLPDPFNVDGQQPNWPSSH